MTGCGHGFVTVDRWSSLDTWKEPGSMQTYAPTEAATGLRRLLGDVDLAKSGEVWHSSW